MSRLFDSARLAAWSTIDGALPNRSNAGRAWQLGELTGFSGAALGRELVRYATLAPSSHNSQCCKFAVDPNGRSIALLPDLARRCPAVDPDDHHIFASLGCATENLIQAALAHGLKGAAQFDPASDTVRVTLEPMPAQSTPSPIPTWLGDLAFSWFFRTKAENEKYVRQMRSSAGVAVFVGGVADKAHWVDVGRCYERFALQAAALGIRNAFLNRPVEVPSVRAPFADAMGFAGQRPDLVVRFGRGPTLPQSLRRPLQAVAAALGRTSDHRALPHRRNGVFSAQCVGTLMST